MALEVAAVEMLIGAVALGGESDEVAAIGARRVGTDARGEGVGLKGADDGAAQRVEGDACALALAVLPCAHVQGRYVGRDFHFEAFAVGKGGHHLIALVLHVMAREVVGQLVGEVEDAGVFGLDGVLADDDVARQVGRPVDGAGEKGRDRDEGHEWAYDIE